MASQGSHMVRDSTLRGAHGNKYKFKLILSLKIAEKPLKCILF